MYSRNTSKLLLLAIPAMAGMLGLQLYWFSQAFDLEERNFRQQLELSLRAAGDKILKESGDSLNQIPPIAFPDEQSFQVEIRQEFLFDMAEQVLNDALVRHGIDAAYRLLVYDCEAEELVFGFDLAVAEAGRELPCVERTHIPECYHLRLVFPQLGFHFWKQMRLWTLSAIVFLFMLAYFGYSLYVLQQEKRLAKMRKDFISNLTHELKTPITNIGMASEILMQSPPNSKRYLSIIQEEQQRLQDQVERILQIAVMEAKGLEIHPERLPLYPLLQEVCKAYALILQQRNGSIQLQCEEHLMIIADPVHLRNAMSNLLDNAIKYSPQQIQIHIRAWQEDSEVVIEVQDEGEGIPSEDLERIFEPFYRISRGDTHDVKGIGLGLSYVQQVMVAHGTLVEVSSRLGEGSCFRLRVRRWAKENRQNEMSC